MERSKIVIEKAIDRVRKLLSLAKGTSEHEAASAAASAAKLIEQFELTEAMIRVDDVEAKPEPIDKRARLEPDLPSHGRKRVAWKETIAQATASDVGVKIYWVANVDIHGFGRESSIQTWRYTFQYLCRAVDELADKECRRSPSTCTAASAHGRTPSASGALNGSRCVSTRLASSARRRASSTVTTLAPAPTLTSATRRRSTTRSARPESARHSP
jgi:hypothetical protein